MPILPPSVFEVCTLLSTFEPVIAGSGTLMTIEKTLPDSTRIHLSHTCNACIRQGDPSRLSVRLDQALAPYLITESSGDRLRIGLRPGRQYRTTTFAIDLCLPDLAALELRNASRAEVSGFSFSHDFTVHLSRASRLAATADTGDVLVTLSGASRLTLRGEGETVRVTASGASFLDLERFRVKVAMLNLSGASDATVSVDHELGGTLKGASRLRYGGDPDVRAVVTRGVSSMARLRRGEEGRR